MIYAFGDYRLDEEALELRGPEGVVNAEPRVLESLIYLVRHRGRVISKDELAEQVWQGIHVTDSAIARSIMGARRAIGDDASRPVAIHTVHGRGYRFDQPVTEQASLDTGLTGRRRRRRLAVAVAVATAVLALLALVWLRRGPGLAFADGGPIPLSLQVEAPAGNDPLQLMALLLTEDLRRALDRMPEVQRLDEEAAAGAGGTLRVSLTPGAAAGYFHFEASLLPGPAEEGSAAVLLARHQFPQRLSTVGAERFAALRTAAVRQLTRRLGRVLRQAPAESGPEEEAWLLFLRATADWQTTCDGGVAVEQLTRSVELDPDAAAAWYVLANAYLEEVSFCAGDASLLERSEKALQRAIELDPGVPERRHLQARLLLHRGEVEEAYAGLRRLVADHPESLLAKLGLSEALRYAGFLDASRRSFDAALREHPEESFLWDFELVPYPYLYQGRWDRFLALLPGRDSPYFRYYRGYAEWRRGEAEAARRSLEPAFVDHPGDLFARLCQALLANLRGSPGEARVVLEQLARQRAEKGAVDGEVSYKLGELLVMAGAADEGLEQLSLAVDQGFFCPRCLASDPLLERLAGEARFRSLLRTAGQRHRRFAGRFGLRPELPAAVVVLEDPADA